VKVLIDTNVLLSAAFRDRLPERVVLYVAGRDDWRWLVTPEIMKAYIGVLRRPKFGLSPETLAKWQALLDIRTISVGTWPIDIDFPRDPKDAPFLAAALAAEASFLITGDSDWLTLETAGATRILTAASFAGCM